MFEKLFKKYHRIIFFDTETTGFDPKEKDQIIELAAIAVDWNGKKHEMDDFIHLFRMDELPTKIVDLTGINDLILASQGIEEVEAVRKFVELMQHKNGDVLLVAHNASFDLRFMAYAIYRHLPENRGWMKVFNDCDYLDTMTVYKDRRMYPHKLESAIAAYHLTTKVENSHRAIDDCKALFEVTKAMDQEQDDLIEYINLFGFNPKYGPDEDKLKKVTYTRQNMNAVYDRKLYELVKERR